MDYYTRQFLIQLDEMQEVEEYWEDVDAEYIAEREYMAGFDDQPDEVFEADCPF